MDPGDRDRLLQHDVQLTDVGKALVRLETQMGAIEHWIHNGGNPTGTERRIRHLEQWRAFLAGSGAALTVALTAAIAWVARGN